MPSMHLTQSNLDLSSVDEIIADYPDNAYYAWCQALGANYSTNLLNAVGLNRTWLFDLQAAILPGFTSLKSYLGSEGNVGVFLQDRANTTHTDVALPLVEHCRIPTYPPHLILSAAVESIRWKVLSGKMQKAGNVTMLAMIFVDQPTEGDYGFEMAVRLSPGQIIVVGQSETVAAHLIATQQTEGTTGIVSASSIDLVSWGDTMPHQTTITIAAPAVPKITGVAKFTDGAVATQVRVWKVSDGSLLATPAITPVSGVFTADMPNTDPVMVTITKTGYRPLTHGPIIPA